MDPGDQLGLAAIIFLYIVVAGGGLLLGGLFWLARKAHPKKDIIDSNGNPIPQNNDISRHIGVGVIAVIIVLILVFTIPILLDMLYGPESVRGFIN